MRSSLATFAVLAVTLGAVAGLGALELFRMLGPLFRALP